MLVVLDPKYRTNTRIMYNNNVPRYIIIYNITSQSRPYISGISPNHIGSMGMQYMYIWMPGARAPIQM